MDKEFVQKDGLEGWINEDGAWLEPPKIIATERVSLKVNLPTFILNLPYDLQDDLIGYVQTNSLLQVVFNTNKIFLEDIDKLVARVEYDYTNNKLSEGLKNAIVTVLEGLK